MDFRTLKDTFYTLLSDSDLNVKSNLQTRADALDNLAFISEVIKHNPEAPDLFALTDEVDQLRHQLESIDKEVFQETHESLKSPETTPTYLRELFNTYTGYKPNENHHIHVDYEALDVLLAGTLFQTQGPSPQIKLDPEMVQWEASPGSVILDLLDHVTLQADDVFFDIGSGLGNVAVIVNRLSGVKTMGIERDPAYCRYSRNLARDLSLDNLTFINADARDADLSSGTVFYLFTPFVASILRTVLEKIHLVAQSHPIQVCSFGPCTPEIASFSWLHNVSGDSQHEFKLVTFKADEQII